MTEEQIQPQSAVDSQPKLQKPRKQKVSKDPNAPFIREKLELPEGHNKLLLHSCCAPCSGEVMEAILASGIEFTIYFYNPNIHPLKEYLIRKEENIRFAQKFGIPFIDADYDRQQWFDRAKGMEWEPERGIRCTMCFICALKKPLNMLMNMVSLCLLVALVFLAGKTCIKLMVVGPVQLKNMMM